MHFLLYWLLFFTTVLLTAVLGTVATLWLFLTLWPGWRRDKVSGRIRTGVVLGSGGHTTEMMKMVSALDKNIYTPRTYYIAQTDTFSKGRLEVNSPML